MRGRRPDEAARAAAVDVAWRDAIATAAISLLANLLSIWVIAAAIGWSLGQSLRVAHAMLCVGAIGYLFRRRRRTMAEVVISFLAIMLPIAPLMVIWSEELLQIDPTMHAVIAAFQMIVMGTAFLTPTSFLLGAALVAAFSGEALLLWQVLAADSAAAEISSLGGATMVLSAAISLGLLLHRSRTRDLAQRLIRAEVELATLERFAAISDQVRDRVNTPLQVLELGVNALSRRVPEEAPLLDRMRRAIERLVQLSSRLSRSGAAPARRRSRDQSMW